MAESAPIDLDALLAELDACATGDGPMSQAARALRALRADFERASVLAWEYGRTAADVDFIDYHWLDAARARWASSKEEK